jgi:hypothetical protein
MVAANYEVFDVTCRYCGITYQILADREDLDSWMNGSGYIQDILGYLSAAERELLISGTCDNCWKNMFSQDFDVDDDEE